MAVRGPQNCQRGQKGVYPEVFGHSRPLLQNEFFDSSTPSIKKGCDKEKGPLPEQQLTATPMLMPIQAKLIKELVSCDECHARTKLQNKTSLKHA